MPCRPRIHLDGIPLHIVQRRHHQIGLAVDRLEREMTITVSDNGIGITAAALPHIFDLFVQDTKLLTRDNRELGIGLAVVRDLVEAHGGRGLGSEFAVTLPLSRPRKFAAGEGVTG